MRKTDQLALVVEMACLTEDRSKREQKALLETAKRIDRERNRLTISNPRVVNGVLAEHSNLVGLVESTWSRPLEFVPCEGSGVVVPDDVTRVKCPACGVECATEVVYGLRGVMDHSRGKGE